SSLRSSGRRLSEICSLAIDGAGEGRVFLDLFRIATLYLMHFTPVTDALVTLKPSHADFYGRRLGFEPLGGLKLDERFGNAPTVAMRIDKETAGWAGTSRISRKQSGRR